MVSNACARLYNIVIINADMKFCCLQGHFQIALNRERCPLLQKRLSWGMRILYMSGVWSYIVGLTSTPTFIIIPLVRLSLEISACFVSLHILSIVLVSHWTI